MTLTVAELDEAELLERIIPLLPQGHRTVTGPGDDAAVLNVPSGQAVISTDVLVEGHHFRTDWSTPEDVGYRAAVQNLADIAAMGANPTAMVVGLVLPPDTPVEWVEGIARGLAEATEPVGVGVIGGDLVAGQQLVIAITVHGETFAQPVLRAGAGVGDLVCVAGTLGKAAAGFALKSTDDERDHTHDTEETQELISLFRRPVPPLTAGVAAAAGRASAMMDLSDGLLKDAGRLAAASGVTIDFDSGAFSGDLEGVEPARLALDASAEDAMSWVVTGGEDHGLLATFPADVEELPEGFRVIGVVGEQAESAVTINGELPDVNDSGWDHFDRR